MNFSLQKMYSKAAAYVHVWKLKVMLTLVILTSGDIHQFQM